YDSQNPVAIFQIKIPVLDLGNGSKDSFYFFDVLPGINVGPEYQNLIHDMLFFVIFIVVEVLLCNLCVVPTTPFCAQVCFHAFAFFLAEAGKPPKPCFLAPGRAITFRATLTETEKYLAQKE